MSPVLVTTNDARTVERVNYSKFKQVSELVTDSHLPWHFAESLRIARVVYCGGDDWILLMRIKFLLTVKHPEITETRCTVEYIKRAWKITACNSHERFIFYNAVRLYHFYWRRITVKPLFFSRDISKGPTAPVVVLEGLTTGRGPMKHVLLTANSSNIVPSYDDIATAVQKLGN
jgi:hypothetical protein